MHELKYLFRRLLLKIFSMLLRSSPMPANVAIDVIIPVIKKDLKILPLCLEGVRTCSKNKIDNIYIVAPLQDEIISFCEKNGLIFVNELSVIGYGPKEINLVNSITGSNRSGWIFQQLIKLSGNVGTCRNYLCIDADHVLVQPHVFVDANDNFVFYMSSELHEEYYANIVRLMKGTVNIKSIFSYVSHKMIFDKVHLSRLRQDISALNELAWDEAILKSLNKEEDAGFSEFELYGNYLPENIKKLRPWDNLNLHYYDILSYKDLQNKYGHKFKALTFSEHMNL